MILSEWFHKLKNMGKPRAKHSLPSYSLTTTKTKKTSSLPNSSSSHLSNRSHTCLESKVSPRNSLPMLQSKRKTVYKPSPRSSSSVSSGFNKKKIKSLQKQDSSNFKLSSSADDIIINMNNRDFKKKTFKEIKMFDLKEKASPASNRAKEPHKTNHLSVKVKNKEEDGCRIQKTLVSNGRRSPSNSPSIKLKVSSPRIQISPRRSKPRSQNKQVLDSFAVTKSSVDPKKDFKESMAEMIEENNIRASQDLENLLACYLSLNPKEYHDLIIKVFVQVWLEVTNYQIVSK